MSNRSSAVAFSVLLGTMLAVGCKSSAPLSCVSTQATAPRNFGSVVDPSCASAGVYRGGQLRTCGEIAFLKEQGVKTIVKLNEGGSALDADEKRQAEAAGIAVKRFSLSAWSIGKPGTCDKVKEVLRLMENESNRPVYVHCSAGRDRTGYIVGAYEELVLGRAAGEVLTELATYGHHGYPALLFPQIRRELKTGSPRCGI